MEKFLSDDFLLSNETAKNLYHEYAKKMPIIDYHCHLSPKEISEDLHFKNITRIWLGGDHYKWRQMRSNGIAEELITGNADDYEKFAAYAKTLEKAIGNPLYHWSHLELKNYFGYEGNLNSSTAKEVWELCNKQLGQGGWSAQKLIEKSNVEVICTTDDPADSLEWHKKIKEDGCFAKVLPTFRPDKALGIEKADYIEYLGKLSAAADIEIAHFSDLEAALLKRMDYFSDCGCRVSDHGLEYVMYEKYTREEAESIFQKRLSDKELSQTEIRKFKTALFYTLGRGYAERGFAMQIHYGVIRDINTKIFTALGADAGIDAIGNYSSSKELAAFLDSLAKEDALPRTILYPLNPIDNAYIGTIIGCFQDSSAVGKIQHGSAWWFNDHKLGMQEQMSSLANLGLLGNFIGMLTDSRSFLSYARHEYFRRILCNMVGTWVENGEFPNEQNLLKPIIEGISYKNAKQYFTV